MPRRRMPRLQRKGHMTAFAGPEEVQSCSASAGFVSRTQPTARRPKDDSSTPGSFPAPGSSCLAAWRQQQHTHHPQQAAGCAAGTGRSRLSGTTGAAGMRQTRASTRAGSAPARQQHSGDTQRGSNDRVHCCLTIQSTHSHIPCACCIEPPRKAHGMHRPWRPRQRQQSFTHVCLPIDGYAPAGC